MEREDESVSMTFPWMLFFQLPIFSFTLDVVELHRAVVACSHQTVRIGVAPVDRVDLGCLDRFWDTKVKAKVPWRDELRGR